ncbi:MAG: PQQ-dependent sugar dehydrogenase [Chloroflexi bacterium]|nr:PQQ-dependent sugar dehydrogenase [Chloroflexota bacterium]
MSPAPRRRFLFAAGLFAGAVLLACGGSSMPDRTPPATGSPSPSPSPASTPAATPDATSTAAVATPSPAATEAPDPPDQPPAAVLVPAFPGLPEYERPIDLVHLPAQNLVLIVLQEGRVLGVPPDGPYDAPYTVHDQRESTACCNEDGLLSIALDPDFRTNGYVYAFYSAAEPRGVSRLSRFATTGQGETFAFDPASELTLFEVGQPYVNHNGGTVLFGPDGMLYLGIGDGGAANDPHGHGQNLRTHLSTIIRIDVRNATRDEPYAIPPDNPFVDEAGALPEIWAYGLRNPWRMSFDRETGLLWAGDVGQNDVEEVSIIERGGNYGWKTMEGSRCFHPETGCDRSGLILPVWEYSHAVGCSITGGLVYRGEAIPALYGWYVYTDYCTGHITAIHAETAATRGFVEPVVLWDKGPIEAVSFAEDAGGELYFVTFRGIFRLVAP